MSQAAQEAQAQETDGHQSDLAKTIEAQNDQIRGVAGDGNPFPEFSEPHLMIDGKAGVEITTPATVHVAAQQVALTSEGHVGVASGRSFFASVRDTISLFAQRAAIRISAALGDIVLHALTSSIKLESAKSIQLLTKVIQITGVEKLELQGGKTRMVLDDSGAQIFTPGKFVAFASTHSLPGPKDAPVSLTPKSICIECLLKAARGGAALVPRQ